MIKLFRNIRQNLINQGKTGKYLKYAVGEIILVVIGILIAIQLNNWNEARENEDQFKAILEQIYTVIDQDIDNLILIQIGLAKQMAIIDSIQRNPEGIDPYKLPHFLFYIDLAPGSFTSEVSYQIGYLNFNPKNLLQSNLNKNLTSYAYAYPVNQHFDANLKHILPQLEKINVPFPQYYFGYSAANDINNIDINFFNDEEIERAINLLADPLIQTALKSSRGQKVSSSVFIENKIILARTNQTAIKNYYPGVKLLYGNIGLVGDATANNNWEENIPLKLTNNLESIWETDEVLDNGFVKFRENNNWNFSWGGNDFPVGTGLINGPNIPVQAGKYHIIFNLSDKTYEFIKQDD